MKRLAILALALTLAACSSLQLQQVHTNIDTIHATFGSFMSGKISAGELKLADIQNARTIYDAHFAATGNPFDKADSGCMTTLAAYYPTLLTLFGPAAPVPQGAPVTGFFSVIAAGSVAVEDTAANVAAKEAVLRKGLPPELEIACAPWFMRFTGARTLAHSGTQ